MSIQAVGWVLDHSQARGFARLVLISLANNANKIGADCRPSIALIADEAKVSRASAFRAIETLERDGEILVRRGKGRGNENRYVLVMGREKGIAEDLFENPEGDGKVPKKFHKSSIPLRARVDIRPSDSITHRPTLRERETTPPELSTSSVSASAVTSETAAAPPIDVAPTNGVPAERPIRPVPKPPKSAASEQLAMPTPAPASLVVSAEMRQTAIEIGVSPDRIEAETRKFLAHYRSTGATRADWNAAWELWMHRAVEREDRAPPFPALSASQAPHSTDDFAADGGLAAWKAMGQRGWESSLETNEPTS